MRSHNIIPKNTNRKLDGVNINCRPTLLVDEGLLDLDLEDALDGELAAGINIVCFRDHSIAI